MRAILVWAHVYTTHTCMHACLHVPTHVCAHAFYFWGRYRDLSQAMIDALPLAMAKSESGAPKRGLDFLWSGPM